MTQKPHTHTVALRTQRAMMRKNTQCLRKLLIFITPGSLADFSRFKISATFFFVFVTFLSFSCCSENENSNTYVENSASGTPGTITLDTTWQGTDTFYYDGEHLYQ